LEKLKDFMDFISDLGGREFEVVVCHTASSIFSQKEMLSKPTNRNIWCS